MPITPITDLPEGVIGFTASGKITEQDYTDVLGPAVDGVLADHEKLRILYVLAEDFDGYSGGAMWEDAKLGAHHLTKFEACAFVGDHAGLRHLVEVFGFLIPGKVKAFSLAELAEARAWICA